MRTRPKNPEVYNSRNMLVCKVVGAKARASAALVRLHKQKRPPKWLCEYLAGIIERLGPVSEEMAAHRDEAW